jgi:hypothetical protein
MVAAVTTGRATVVVSVVTFEFALVLFELVARTT